MKKARTTKKLFASSQRRYDLNPSTLTYTLNWDYSEGCCVEPTPNINFASIIGYTTSKERGAFSQAIQTHLQNQLKIQFHTFAYDEVCGQYVNPENSSESVIITISSLGAASWLILTLESETSALIDKVYKNCCKYSTGTFDLVKHQSNQKNLEKSFAGEILELKWITGLSKNNSMFDECKKKINEACTDSATDGEMSSKSIECGSYLATKYWLLNTKTQKCIGKALISYRNVEMYSGGITIQMLEIPKQLRSIGLGKFFYEAVISGCATILQQITCCREVKIQVTFADLGYRFFSKKRFSF